MGFDETLVQLAYSKISDKYTDNLMIDTLYEVQAANSKLIPLADVKVYWNVK